MSSACQVFVYRFKAIIHALSFVLRAMSISRALKYLGANFSRIALRALATQLLSLLLLVSICTTSTPAAAPTLLTLSTGVRELGEDARYAYLANFDGALFDASVFAIGFSDASFLDYFAAVNPVLGIVTGIIFKKSRGARRRQQARPRAVRLELSPKDATIRQGEQIALTAVGIDERGAAIGGTPVVLTAQDRAGRTPPIVLDNGFFEPLFSGDFLIAAEGDGARAETTVHVVTDAEAAFQRRRAVDQLQDAREAGGLERRSRGVLPEDQAKIAAEPLPAPVANSSRMEKSLDPAVVRQGRQLPVERAARPAGAFVPLDPAKALVTPETVERIRQQMQQSPQVPNNQPNQPSGGPNADNMDAPDAADSSNPAVTAPEESTAETAPAAAVRSSSPLGNLDGVTAERYVRGWTFDPDAPGQDLMVHFYIDGPAGSGTFAGAVPADRPRADVNSAFGIPGNHGYEFALPTVFQDGQPHTVYAYGIDATGNPNQLLAGSAYWFQFAASGNPHWNDLNAATADDPNQQPGNPSGSGTSGAGSGNFSFSIPVLAQPSRGEVGINLALTYNSQLWQQANGEMTYDIDKGFPAPGWSLNLYGKLMDMGVANGAMIESPDGTRHSYEGVLQPSGAAGYSTYYGHTTDGSLIDYVVGRTPAGISWATAYFPDGMTVSYSATNEGVAYPSYVKDRHGNSLVITYYDNVGPYVNYIKDDRYRHVFFNYDANKRLVALEGPALFGGSQTLLRIHYRDLQLGYAFSGMNALVRHPTVEVVDAIYSPLTNTGYWFGDADSYSSYGMLAKIVEQRGMSWTGNNIQNQGWAGLHNYDMGTVQPGTTVRQVTYNYPLNSNSALTQAPQYTQVTETWDKMDTAQVVTTYNVQNNANPRTTSVTLPNGNTIRQSSFNNPNQWNDGLLYQVETISPTNQILSKAVTNWQQGEYGSPRVAESLTTDEKNQTTRQVFNYYGQYNQVASVQEFGYANNLFRTRAMIYENGANYTGVYQNINGMNVYTGGQHIFNLLKLDDLYDAGNQRVARTVYNYDQYPLLDTPNVVYHEERYNPYTTQGVQGANCQQWGSNWVPDASSAGGHYEYYCTQYTSSNAFDPSTNFRGNVTQTISYTDAANESGAIAYDSTYDMTGNLRTTTTNCCQQMSFNYTDQTQYALPQSHTKGSSDPNSPDRMTEYIDYEYNTLLANTQTDFNGRTTQTVYDSARRPVHVTYPTGAYAQYSYNDAAGAYAQKTSEANGTLGSYSETLVNGRGQPVEAKQFIRQTANFYDPANYTIAYTKYDSMGRTFQQSVPAGGAQTPNLWTTYSYDQLSRVVQVSAPDGSIAQTFYNEAQQPQGAASTTGSTVRSRDAWGRERWARADDFGRTVEVVEPDPNGSGSIFDPGSLQTAYTYDAKDQLVQVTQGSQVRAFRYDSLGRLKLQKLAEQTATINDQGQYVGANNGGSWSDAFQYDNRSNLTQRVDARGVKTNYYYGNFGNSPNGPDPLNRLLLVEYDKSGADQSFPIADAYQVFPQYMTTGDKTRLASRFSLGLQETYAYDTEGRLASYEMSNTGAGQTLTLDYLYDTLNRLTEVRYPQPYGMPGYGRHVVGQSYDESSRLTQLAVDNQTHLSDIVYDPLSRVTQLKTGAATNNADLEQYTYDQPTGLLTNQKVIKQNTNATLLDQSYEYQRGNSNGTQNGITGQLTKIVNNLDHNKNRVYEFDSLGRLKTAKGGAAAGIGNPVANWTQAYGYDRYGNRTNVMASGVTGNNQAAPTDGIPNQSYNQNSNRITTAGYQYDLAGNLVRGQDANGNWQRYEYDAAGRLVEVKDDNGTMLTHNGYASTRQRLLKFEGGVFTWYVWGGSSVVAEFTSTNWGGPVTRSKEYFYAGSRLLSTITNVGGNEVTEFQHPDRLGTKLITNDSANTSFEQSTLPFGTALNAESTGATNQRFTSYDRSTVAQLDYAVNRSYSSGQGRFTSVDPAQDGMNLYAYANNDPINFTDPTGLNAQAPGGQTCYVDGIMTPCSQAYQMAGSGSAVFAPGPLTQWDQSANGGKGEYQFFRAYGNGQSGYYNMQGVSITAFAFVNGEYAGSASWLTSYLGRTTTSGNSGRVPYDSGVRDERPRVPEKVEKKAEKPCDDGDDSTLDINISAVEVIGIQGGMQINNRHVSFYLGGAAGIGPPLAITVTGSKSKPADGANFNATLSALGAVGYGGELDMLRNPNNEVVTEFGRMIGRSVKKGTVSGGAGTPTASAGFYIAGKFRHTCR